MVEIKPLQYEEFVRALTIVGDANEVEKEYLYSIYCYTIEGISSVAQTHLLGDFQGVNHLEIIAYIVGEFKYLTHGFDKQKMEAMKNDENIIATISSMVADKYLSLSRFSFNESTLVSRFVPPISTLYVYVNFMLNVTQTYNKKDPQTSLLVDLFVKSIRICKCTLDLLTRGFETEAFSCWRTLHECECTLIVLEQYSPDIIKTYLKHMEFGMAFRNTMKDKNKQDEIFQNMKAEMKELGLKSKDIKKYIEYGWLYFVPGVKEDELFKLNFRDGLERIAGLESYSKRYEMSSEIIHGTPLLVYSNREYFYFLTLLSTYESFFRLENLFYRTFVKYVNQDQLTGYQQMRKVYYTHLINIYKRESDNFKRWQTYQKELRDKN